MTRKTRLDGSINDRASEVLSYSYTEPRSRRGKSAHGSMRKLAPKKNFNQVVV
jgi:hypothetical protein